MSITELNAFCNNFDKFMTKISNKHFVTSKKVKRGVFYHTNQMYIIKVV
jgi:hypothetical protein